MNWQSWKCLASNNRILVRQLTTYESSWDQTVSRSTELTAYVIKKLSGMSLHRRRSDRCFVRAVRSVMLIECFEASTMRELRLR